MQITVNMINSRNMRTLAGYLCFLNAGINSLSLGYTIVSEGLKAYKKTPLPEYHAFFIGIDIATTLVMVFCYLQFSRLLRDRFAFNKTNLPIQLLLGMIIMGTFVNTLPRPGMLYGIELDYVVLGVVALQGVFFLITAERFALMEGDCYGYKNVLYKSFWWAGFGLLSLLLASVGFVASIVAEVVMGLVFLKAVKQMAVK